MPIHSDEYPYDMAAWVVEKADSVLEHACRIVDWFRRMDLELSQYDREEVAQELASLLGHAAKLSAFGHENVDYWSDSWVGLMFTQGHDRFLEWQQRADAQVPNDVPPLEWPLSIQRVIDLIDETESVLRTGSDNKTLVREHVQKTGKALIESRLEGTKPVGHQLLDLIDSQVVHATLSWSDFIRECDAVLVAGRESFVEEAESSLEPWA